MRKPANPVKAKPAIPHLMPFQLEAFNGDKFIEKKFLELKEKYGIDNAVETGTCLGGTTLWLARNFEEVFTVERNPEYLKIAQHRAEEAEIENIEWFLGDSAKELYEILIPDPTIYFLDAHWSTTCPLPQELTAIQETMVSFPVICIHDFKTGDDRLGFDSIGNQPFEIEWLRPYLDKIYSDCEKGYSVEYNTFEKSEGAKRGIVYITPNL